MRMSGWGRHPLVEASCRGFRSTARLRELLAEKRPLIAHALGRSYGDSALADALVMTGGWDCVLDFDPESGVVAAEAGVSLDSLVKTFLPRGFFPPVTPGTRFVSLGGAVASDVHGKNHHRAGTFGQHVRSLEIMLPDGETVTASPELNSDLFHATCGGMGLTGIITRVDFSLARAPSAFMRQTTIRAANLEEIIGLFQEHASVPYSVAWIDCLARGEKMGRSLLMVGDHDPDAPKEQPAGRAPGVPCDLPSFTLNRMSVAAFNTLYFHKSPKHPRTDRVSIDSFFYPLDAVDRWNRIYGRRGFTQYQFVLPVEASRQGLTRILSMIADSGRGSFLAVLKLMGEANENWLSFPMSGFTLALDFPIRPGLFELLDELDRVVIDHGGRLYLAKDCRMGKAAFDAGYPLADRFRAFRRERGMAGVFESLQSQRLEL